ncbi:phage head closure protein [Clostridium sp. BNL1100]|uniref:phage head closure protein n=1 Tax=Clostridium sp. BNL1100 TaxID=755731 RepID=UPI00024A7F12|nr:phage head closure protein [Clostridium sp. BNL1100]AEY65419.1 phage head-tail adaptor, putative, SPP1 family [Clostridium sp. BNL1100]
MNPGELKHRIRIQKKTKSIDNKGHPVETWVDFGATQDRPEVFRWAKWVWLHGNEFYAAAAAMSKATANITIRYIPNLTPDMSVLYKGKRYGILPPIDNIREENKVITFKVYTIEAG